MIIKVKIERVFGRECIYPMDEKAKMFCDMLKRKTLMKKDLGLIKSLGFDIEVIQQESNLSL